jgi:hypothetical protein
MVVCGSTPPHNTASSTVYPGTIEDLKDVFSEVFKFSITTVPLREGFGASAE